MPGNEQGARHRRPADIPVMDVPTVPLAANVVVLERLEDGDIAGAVEVLLAADEWAPAPGERRCPLCSWRGFPGALEHHALYGHGLDWDAAEELVRRAA